MNEKIVQMDIKIVQMKKKQFKWTKNSSKEKKIVQMKKKIF